MKAMIDNLFGKNRARARKPSTLYVPEVEGERPVYEAEPASFFYMEKKERLGLVSWEPQKKTKIAGRSGAKAFLRDYSTLGAHQSI